MSSVTTESIVLTVRLLILERLAETWTQNWLNTNERPRTVISGITFLDTIDRTKHKINWDSAECVTYSTNYQPWLTLESWYTNSEQELLNRCQQEPAPYKRLTHTWPQPKRTYKQTNNRRIENNSQTTTDQSLQLLRFDDQSHHDKTDRLIQTKTRDINTIIWRQLFTWLWRWLPFR